MIRILPAAYLAYLFIISFLSGCSAGQSLPTLASTAAPPTAPGLPSASAVDPEPSPTAGVAVENLPITAGTLAAKPIPSPTPEPLPPTDTPEPTATPTATASPTPDLPTATPIIINDVSLEDVIILDEEAGAHIREIFARGQRLGRDEHAFSRLGASIVATHHFLGRFDSGPYDLGPYAYLQPTIDQFSGSFSRVGVAALRGLSAAGVFDPVWSNEDECLPNENVLDCEIRLHNPSILLISLGTNDKWDAVSFEKNLRKLVAYTIEQGVIPALATKADRFEGEDNRNNLIIRQVAADFQVPMWDFDLLAETLPDRGMGSDGVHLTIFDYYDYNMDSAFRIGYGVYNLTALMMLHEIQQQLAG